MGQFNIIDCMEQLFHIKSYKTWSHRDKIIARKFWQGKSMAEIGRLLNTSRERIRQILNNLGIHQKKTDGFKAREGEAAYYNLYGLPKKIKEQIFKRDNYTCYYCGKTNLETKLVVDHKMPTSRGGTHEFTNLITACSKCNTLKGYKTDKEFINNEKIKIPNFVRERFKKPNS